MKRFFALLLAIVMAFGLVACGNTPTANNETTASAAKETTVNDETTASADPMKLPTPDIEFQSFEGNNGTVFTVSKYYKLHINDFRNEKPLYENIHFVGFDYEGWAKDHPDVPPYNEERSWTLSISGDELVEVNLYGYGSDENDDQYISAYIRTTHLKQKQFTTYDLESTPGEVWIPSYINGEYVTLIVATMRDSITGDYYYEYFGRCEVGQ